MDTSSPRPHVGLRSPRLRRTLTRGTDVAAAWLVSPLVASFAISRRLVGDERAYLIVSERAARWSGMTGERLRAAVHRRLGSDIGRGAVLRFGCVLKRPPLSIGSYTVVSHYACIQHARIGPDCLIGDHANIFDGKRQHKLDRLDVPLREQGIEIRQVTVGRDCLIGGHAVVLADIGDHCVVGAGSVVLEPVPDYKIVAGNPARVVGDRRDRVVAPIAEQPPTNEVDATRETSITVDDSGPVW
jgi:virginiamycin A acetyltransferase